MKYRIIKIKAKAKKSKKAEKETAKSHELIRDPDGDNETIGTYGSIQAAKEKLRHVVCNGD